MKKILSVVLVLLLMILSYAAGRRQKARPVTIGDANRGHVLYWVDPMHPDYKSDHPGVAPDCGMQLEPVYAEPAASIETPAQPATADIDPAKQQLFGIQVARVEKSAGTRKIRGGLKSRNCISRLMTQGLPCGAPRSFMWPCFQRKA